MQKNETTLTPLFRYVICCLEKNGLSNLDKSLNTISGFHKHLKTDSDNPIKKTLDFISIYMKDKDQAKLYWEDTKKELENIICNKCYVCEKCQSYFWQEIGSLFFDEVVNEEKRNKKYFPMRILPEKIRKHLESSVSLSEIYINHTKRNRYNIDNKLIILKGMSSSTPSMLNSIFDTDDFDGGGIYFRWNGCGIVIDPGYHFVRNLHHYGLSVLDIDVVVITHEHIDHNNDMRLLEDIHFTLSRYGTTEGKEHTIKWYMDEVSYKMARILQDNKSAFKQEANELYWIDPVKMVRHIQNEKFSLSSGLDISKNIKMFVFKTEHIYDHTSAKYKTHTFGCRFRIQQDSLNCNIVYTSDTRYFPELVEQIKNADILIANISGIYEDDYMLVREKDNHLGYYGCYQLINKCFTRYHQYPKLYFLSEFWNGKSDIRFDIVSQLYTELKEKGLNDISVFPAELGLIVDLLNLTLKCSKCGKYSNNIIVKKPDGLHDKVDFLCKECYY